MRDALKQRGLRLAAGLLSLILGIMTEHGDFDVPYLLPVLWTAFLVVCVSLVPLARLRAWFGSSVWPSIATHRLRWSIVLVVSLQMVCGLTWLAYSLRSRPRLPEPPATVSPAVTSTHQGPPTVARHESDRTYQIYIRARSTPMRIRHNGELVTTLESANPFVTLEGSAGEHTILAEDPDTGATYQRRIRLDDDQPRAILFIPGSLARMPADR